MREILGLSGKQAVIVAGVLILFGYLCGSVSFAYLSGRIWRNIDLREYGSAKLSGSNVYHHVSLLAMVAVGLLDIGKAALPTWVGLWLGLGLPAAILAGLAAMIGHNWPIFLGLKGGRGIAAAIGTLLVVFPWGFPWLLGWLIVGRLMPRAAAAPALLGFITLPFLAHAAGQAAATVWGCIAMLIITVTKRLEANRVSLPPGPERWAVLARRLVLDRDEANWESWIQRAPRTDAR